MARYGVQVVGEGDQCFVVASVPGEGGFTNGPMSESEAVAMAESMSKELFAMKAGVSGKNHLKVSVRLVLITLAVTVCVVLIWISF